MTIHLNGSENPLAVKYNGTNLGLVYAVVGGVSSVFPVWGDQSAIPDSIDVIRVRNDFVTRAYARLEGCVDIYLRDLTLTGWYYGIRESTGQVFVVSEYGTGGSSFNLKFRRYVRAGDIDGNGGISFGFRMQGGAPTITGIPSGFEYDHFEVETDYTFNLDFKVSGESVSYDDYDSRIQSMQTINIVCGIEKIYSQDAWASLKPVSTTFSPRPGGHSIYTALQGAIVTGAKPKVTFYREVPGITF